MKGLYLCTILSYICLLWTVSFFQARKSRSSEAYLVASRALPVPLVSVLIAGTWIGGVSIVGMAQGAYLHGISALWFQAGIWLAMCVTSALLGKIMEGKNTYSILDVVGNLYDKKTAQLAGVMQLVFLVWIITMQIVGGGAILFVIFGGDVSFGQGMALTAIVFTLYNVTGGFAATAYTNLIHICAIIIGIFMGGLYVILNAGALAQVASQGHYFQLFGDLGPSQALSWAFINLTLGVLAQPVINTASSARNIREGRRGILIGNFIAVPVVVMAALCGIAAKGIFPNTPSLGALPALLATVPTFVAVFFLISMWAPLMSCGSPFLMGATTLAVKGYIGPLFHIDDDKKLLAVSRTTTLLLGGLSLLLGFFVREILREITWIAVLLSAIVYVVFIGWAGKRIRSAYAYASLLGTVFILFLCLVFGIQKVLHPIWPVTIYVTILMGIGFFVAPVK
jgi:SSS family solute:Na+ symporter